MAYTSVRITANASDYRAQMKSAAAQMKELASEYSLTATKAKLSGSAMDTLKAKAESLTRKVTMQKNIVQMNREEQGRLTEQLGKQKTKQEELQAKVEAARKAYEGEKKATGENSDAAKALKEELDKLEKKFRDNETAIGRTETALSNQTVKVNRSETALVEMTSELEKTNKELKNHNLNVFSDACDKAGQKIEQFGKKMTIVSTGIAGLATVAIKTASDFDSSMSNVQAISGATAEEMNILRNKAREMGEKTKFSAMEAGDAMSYMAMAGWKTEDMLNSIEGIMTLAAASGEDLALTSDIVTDAMTAFGLSADGTTQIIKDGYVKEVSNATHFADILAAASSNANTNVALMGESFKYIAPVAGALGYSAEDTAIALGLMANAGIKASNSGTALRSMLTNLSKPSDEIENAMNYLGISLQNNDGSMKTLMEVMIDLRASFGQCKMPVEEFKNQLAELEEQYESGELTENKYNKAVEDLTEKAYGAEGALKAKYAATLAGKTGMSGLLAIVGSSDKDFDKLTNAIYESDGAAQEMADIMQDNLAGQVTILKSQLQELSISIGEQLIPFLRDGVSEIQNIVDKFNSMSDSQKQTIVTVGLFTAAVGPAVVGIGKFAQGISTTIKTGQKLASGIASIVAKISAKTAATAAGTAADAAGTAATAAHTAATAAGATATGGMTVAQKALNLVMSMNPIMKVVTVVSLLVAGFVALYKNSETFRNAVNKLWSTVKEGFGKIKETILGALDSAKEKIEEVKTKFLNSEIGQAAVKAFNGVKDTVSTVMSAAVDTAKENLDRMKSAYEENGGGIKGIVAAGWEGIKGYHTAGFTFIDNLTGGKLSGIKNKFSEKLGAVKDTVKQKWDDIKVSYEEGGGGVSGILEVMFDQQAETIRSAFDVIQNATGINMEGIKEKVVTGVQTVRNTVVDATYETQNKVKETLGSMKATYEENGGGIKGIVSAGWEGIKGFYSSGFTFIDGLTGGKLSEIKSKFFERTSEIKSDWSSKFTEIKNTATNFMQTAAQNVSAKLDNMKAAYAEKGGGMQGIVAAAFTGIRDTMGSLMEAANILTGGKLENIKSSFLEKLNGAKSTVSSVMNEIRSEFSSKMEEAKSAVSGAIEKIKGFFNFSWSLPHLKMPHPRVSGSFSLNPPSVPSFSIDWYKTGAIMNSPTIFGMNGSTLLAGGEPETGGEAILPLAPFYAKLNDILDRKLSAVQQVQNVYVENHTYIDGDEVSNRTVTKVDAKMVKNRRKGR